MKDDRNNLGRQYTSDPNFGTTYPNTQYKGYSEHEASSFGSPSRSPEHRVAPVNQYGYTSNYQGNNPQHREDRLEIGYQGTQYSGQNERARNEASLAEPYQSSVGHAQYHGVGRVQNNPNQYQSQYQGQNPGHYQGQYQNQYQSQYLNQYSGQNAPQYRGQERSPYQGGLNQYQGSEHGQLQSGGQVQFRPIYQSNAQLQENQNRPFQGSATVPGPAVGLNAETQAKATTGPAATATISPVPTRVSKSPQHVQQQSPTNAQYNDRDRIKDLMLSEKYLAEGYNIGTLDSNNPQLHSTLKELLNDTHSHQETLNKVLQQNGWSKLDQADQQMVSQAHQRFLEFKNQLPF